MVGRPRKRLWFFILFLCLGACGGGSSSSSDIGAQNAATSEALINIQGQVDPKLLHGNISNSLFSLSTPFTCQYELLDQQGKSLAKDTVLVNVPNFGGNFTVAEVKGIDPKSVAMTGVVCNRSDTNASESLRQSLVLTTEPTVVSLGGFSFEITVTCDDGTFNCEETHANVNIVVTEEGAEVASTMINVAVVGQFQSAPGLCPIIAVGLEACNHLVFNGDHVDLEAIQLVVCTGLSIGSDSFCGEESGGNCGNGKIDEGEDCDPGVTSGQVCQPPFICVQPGQSGTPCTCVAPCNNNHICEVKAGETHANCPNDCFCGDNVFDPTVETCDGTALGKCLPGQQCNATCDACIGTVACGDLFCDRPNGESSENCRIDCPPTVCGDNKINNPDTEVCDGTDFGPCDPKGELGPPTRCSNTCFCEELKCDNDGSCEYGEDSINCPNDCAPTCGNGVCEPGESYRSCPNDCSLCCSMFLCNNNGTCEAGEDGLTCEDCAVCGNGRLEPGEGCDDGNTISGDGCSSTCILENTVCGDNITDTRGGEICDGMSEGQCNPQHQERCSHNNHCKACECFNAASPCDNDGFCELGETTANCPHDCSCGDGYCNLLDESVASCTQDCHCGNGVLDKPSEGCDPLVDPSQWESSKSCDGSCPTNCSCQTRLNLCGNGVCDFEENNIENPAFCGLDCGSLIDKCDLKPTGSRGTP